MSGRTHLEVLQITRAQWTMMVSKGVGRLLPTLTGNGMHRVSRRTVVGLSIPFTLHWSQPLNRVLFMRSSATSNWTDEKAKAL